MKRFFLFLMVLMLLAGTAAAEGALPVVQDKLTLTVLKEVRDIDTLTPDNNVAVKKLEELTNVHAEYLDVVKQSDWNTKLSLTLASGELPDVIWSRGDFDFEEYGAVQQLVIPVEDLIDQYMPNLKARLDQDRSVLTSSYASDGHIYGIPSLLMDYGAAQFNSHMYINKEWLDKIGKPVPTTVDELTDVLRAFKGEDFNGNGEADELPYSATIVDGSNCSIWTLLNCYGIPTDGNTFFSINEEGKVTFDPYYPGFRPAVEWLHTLYEENLMDVETLTQPVSNVTNKIANGLVGVFPQWRLINMGIDNTVDTYVEFAPVAAEGYQPKMYSKLSLATPAIYITKDNQHVEETCRWLDTQLEKEIMLNTFYGEQGEHWDYNADGLAEILREGDAAAGECMGVNSFYYMNADWYAENMFLIDQNKERQVDQANDVAAGCLQTYPNGMLGCVTLSSDDNYTVSLLLTDIQTAVNEFVTKAIVSGITDDDWNEFMNICASLQVDEYCSIYQKGLDNLLNK
mgnify:FL=1